VLLRGLRALEEAGLEVVGASQGPRSVDVQFVLDQDALKPAIQSLHAELIEKHEPRLKRAA
jgi:aspartate kinase